MPTFTDLILVTKSIETVARLTIGSTAIGDFDYNVLTGSLRIVFKSGGTYIYSNVSFTVFNGLVFASSKGTYFNANIRNNFEFTRI